MGHWVSVWVCVCVFFISSMIFLFENFVNMKTEKQRHNGERHRERKTERRRESVKERETERTICEPHVQPRYRTMSFQVARGLHRNTYFCMI